MLGIDGYDSYKTWLGDDVEPGPHGKASGDHYANFIDCVRARATPSKIHSPIEEAHISTTLVHLANASYRLGRTLKFDPKTEQVVGDDEANAHAARHLSRAVRRGRKNLNFAREPCCKSLVAKATILHDLALGSIFVS